MVVAVLAILIGAVETMGGLQEAIVQGIIANRSYPLVGGTSGAVAGAFLLLAGIAMWRRSASARQLAWAALGLALPVFAAIGVIRPLAGVPATILGMMMPVAVVVATELRRKSVRAVA